MAQGHDIVLMMDANEPSGAGSAVDNIILACNLTDAHLLAMVTSAPLAMYQRGIHKIDFVLVSQRLVPAVRFASILALHDGDLSDHNALLVDFDANALFAGATLPLCHLHHDALPLRILRLSLSTLCRCCSISLSIVWKKRCLH